MTTTFKPPNFIKVLEKILYIQIAAIFKTNCSSQRCFELTDSTFLNCMNLPMSPPSAEFGLKNANFSKSFQKI
jgi:hypothetical protein